MASYFRKMAAVEIVHALVQFAEAPGLRERKALKKMRIRLLDPITECAFFAAMPPDLSLAERLITMEGLVRWVGVIAPEDKVAPWLLRKGVPAHARRQDGIADMIVQFFGDVALSRQKKILVDHGAKILTRIEELNGWRVNLGERALLRLAAEDSVKWIVEVPAPPEDDNDSVRSATGVNADAILSPAIYDLSGNGVVIGQWEGTHSSLTHVDLAGRITLADPPLRAWERTHSHEESVSLNGQFDDGEAIYFDFDDDGNVSPGDVRLTALGAFPAGSVVAAGDADVGTALVLFNILERFVDNVTADFVYTAGEPVYLDNDNDFRVSVGDARLTPVGAFAAGSIVAAGDPDVGQRLLRFPTNPHYHATHVAGMVIGNGVGSTTQGGSPNQWKGVAPSGTLRSYSAPPILAAEYADAAANGVTISTNSWGTSHIHQIFPPATGYDVGSEYYDAVICGRRSDGTPSGLPSRILILGSAGNQGRPERHTENIALNGQYDAGESIYTDRDDDGFVSAADSLILGPAQPIGTPLVNFNSNEMHDESISLTGAYNNGEGIYSDADGSRTVSVGDTRINAAAGFPAGSVVAAGDADVGTHLRQFKLWGNVRIPNSAKNTIEVANIASDTKTPSPSSSRGPTDDGRIKPDVAGPGIQNSGDQGVTSTFPGNLYVTLTGTSMSTPAVAGAAALLTERYRTACLAAGPEPDTLRALLIHSAEDLVNIPNVGAGFAGPDFAFGYGRVRVKEAVDLLPHHLQGTANAVGDTDYTVTIGAMSQLKVTLVWDDPPWTANAAPSALTGILQNDLDLLLIAPDGTQYTPWVLDPSNPSASSIRSAIPSGAPVPEATRDRRNTVEQVIVDNAMPGTWTIRVTAATLNLPPQTYTLVCEALPPQICPCVLTPADIWMRDNTSDTGAEPSTGTMWLSPDIWNRLNADGMTTHENPEFGQENYIYANIRNASAVIVQATSIDVCLAPVSVGLAWPNNFTYVGRISVPNLGPNEVRQVGPLAWNPPSPTPSAYYCFYVRVTSPQDPIVFAETSSVGNNARNSNNIVWRNIIVVDLASSRSVTFIVRNVQKKEAEVELNFTVPNEFLRQGEVNLRLSAELEKRWPEKYRSVAGLKSLEKRYRVAAEPETIQFYGKQPPLAPQRDLAERLPPPYQLAAPKVNLSGFRMEPNQAEKATLTFRSAQRRRAWYEIHVVERIRGKTIGGITFMIHTGKGKDR